MTLTDSDGDNIYTGIVTNLQDSTDYEYKFLVNTQWGDSNFESAPPLQSSCDFNQQILIIITGLRLSQDQSQWT